MLKNEKVLSNNGKITKGIHLESFLAFDNDSYVELTYSVSGATQEDPTNFFIYDSYGYVLDTVESDVVDSTLRYSNYNTVDKYILTYGNEDAIYGFNFNLDYTIGDLKGFINNYTNLKNFIMTRSRVSQNLDNLEWPSTLEKLVLSVGSTITGDMGTWTGIENVNYLDIGGMGLTGDISNFNNLTYLKYGYYNYNTNLTGSVNDWDFQPNLYYLHLAYNYNLTGDISNWEFPSNIERLFLTYNRRLTGDISNWDFSNCTSDISILGINHSSRINSITGNLSGWTFVDGITIESFTLYQTQITDASLDLSNINISNQFNLSYNYNLTSSLDDLHLPENGITTLNIISNTNMTGDITKFNFPSGVINFQCYGNNWSGDLFAINTNDISGITNFRVNSNNLTGDISGITLWEGLIYYYINSNNITGTLSPFTFPTTLTQFYVYDNNIVLDLTSTFDFGNMQTFIFNDISGVTGDFSNLILNSPTRFYFTDNTFNIDLGNLSISNWGDLETLIINRCVTNGNSDITNFFPSGNTPDMNNIYIDNTDITGDITNWSFSAFSYIYSNIFLHNSDLTGDISNWNCPLSRTINISNTSIYGDIGNMDYTSHPTHGMHAYDSGMYGNLSGVTLDYTIQSFNVENCSGITGVDDFMEYFWVNRKNWIYNFSVNISGVTGAPSGTYELGDLGTYTGHEWDLTEAEINNLVNGIDYDGNGSNTPWNQLQKYYYQKEARLSSISTTAKYKINSIIYNGS